LLGLFELDVKKGFLAFWNNNAFKNMDLENYLHDEID